MLTKQKFASILSSINTTSDKLAEMIHEAGIYSLDQANTYGNFAPGYALVKALGRKHDAKRVVIWLCHFGKFGVKAGEVVAKSKKSLMENWLEEANALTYWELTQASKLSEKIDYLSLLKGIVRKHEKAQERINEGQKLEQHNEHVIAAVNDLLVMLEPKQTV